MKVPLFCDEIELVRQKFLDDLQSASYTGDVLQGERESMKSESVHSSLGQASTVARSFELRARFVIKGSTFEPLEVTF